MAARPLEAVYPVVFLDALVRENDTVRNKAAHLAVGVNMEGKREVLGIWVEATKGAKFWTRVMSELKARGVEDVPVVVCDGLTGLPQAVTTVWPQAIVPTCIVHLTRASLRWVNYKDRKPVDATPSRVVISPHLHIPRTSPQLADRQAERQPDPAAPGHPLRP